MNIQVRRPATGRFLVPLLRRAPLIMVTIIFAMISLRYLKDPVKAAAAAGIAFTSPDGVTVARVGFGGFPLAIAILAFTSLLSTRRLLPGLYMVFTVVTVVIMVRLLGIAVDHSTVQNLRLLVPEAVLLGASIVALLVESDKSRQQS